MTSYDFTEPLYSMKIEVTEKLCKLFTDSLKDVEILIEPDYSKLPDNAPEDYFEWVGDLSGIFALEYSDKEGFVFSVDTPALDELVSELLNSPYNHIKEYIGEKEVKQSISDEVQIITDNIYSSYSVLFGEIDTDLEDINLKVYRALK